MPTVAIAPGQTGELYGKRRPVADQAPTSPMIPTGTSTSVSRSSATRCRSRWVRAPRRTCSATAPPPGATASGQHRAVDGLHRRGEHGPAGALVVVGHAVVDHQHDQPGLRVGDQHAAGQERRDGAVGEVEPHRAVVVGERHGTRVEGRPAAQPTGVLADPFQPRLAVEDAPDGGVVGGVPAQRERGAAGGRDEPEARRPDRAQPLLDRARGEADEVVAVVGGPGQQGGAAGQREELGGPVARSGAAAVGVGR